MTSFRAIFARLKTLKDYKRTRVHVRFVRGLCYRFNYLVFVYNDKKNITRLAQRYELYVLLAKQYLCFFFGKSNIKFFSLANRVISSM